jgi:hypothetical protein
MKVETGNRYKQGKSGAEVRILCTDSGYERYPVIAVDKDGSIFRYTIYGVYDIGDLAGERNLVEIMPYDDWQIDDQVLCENAHFGPFRRHFAGVDEKGRPMTWKNGRTSYTALGTDDVESEWARIYKESES